MPNESVQHEKHHPESIKWPETPDEWLAHYKQRPMAETSYFTSLMDCVFAHGIPSVVRAVPPDLFRQFREFISGVASLENEDDFFVIGSPVAWGVKEARQVFQWLEDRPDFQPPNRG